MQGVSKRAPPPRCGGWTWIVLLINLSAYGKGLIIWGFERGDLRLGTCMGFEVLNIFSGAGCRKTVEGFPWGDGYDYGLLENALRMVDCGVNAGGWVCDVGREGWGGLELVVGW